jgi:hypothetical protein
MLLQKTLNREECRLPVAGFRLNRASGQDGRLQVPSSRLQGFKGYSFQGHVTCNLKHVTYFSRFFFRSEIVYSDRQLVGFNKVAPMAVFFAATNVKIAVLDLFPYGNDLL